MRPRRPRRKGAQFVALLAIALFSSAGLVLGPRPALARASEAAVDHPPVVTTPADVSGAEDAPIVFTATASDPDGNSIDRFNAFFLPPGATFTPDASNTSGTFEWTPGFDQAGSYRVEISAESACRPVTVSRETYETCMTGAAMMTITVANVDRAPLISAPSVWNATEGMPFSFRIGAGDPDGEALTALAAATSISGYEFVTDDELTQADFSWTPGPGATGDYEVFFQASNVLITTVATVIHVKAPPRPPAVTAPAAVSGVEGAALGFTATAADPDGEPIESFTASPLPAGATFQIDAARTTGLFAWTPGDGQAGIYPILLSASSACRPTGVSGALACDVATATTTITVIPESAPAYAFLTNANRVIRLTSGKPTWCAQVEPLEGSFPIEDIVPTSIAMVRLGEPESVLRAIEGKGASGGDRDGNGVLEFTACFGKDGLRAFFADLPKGESNVEVYFTGDLVTGGAFETAPLPVAVIAGGGRVAARVAPNPMNPAATLTFTTTRPGRVRVSLYDLQGRLVRHLLDAASLPAGDHDVRVVAESASGVPLSSGVYFYRVASEEGSVEGRVVIAK